MQYRPKWMLWWDMPFINQSGMCHVIHMQPVINVAVGNGNFFSSSGCIVPRHPSSSLPPLTNVADSITIGAVYQGSCGLISIEENPMTAPCIAQNNNRYQKLFFWQEKINFNTDMGRFSGNTKIAAIVGPKPPRVKRKGNRPCEEWIIFRFVSSANPHQDV